MILSKVIYTGYDLKSAPLKYIVLFLIQKTESKSPESFSSTTLNKAVIIELSRAPINIDL